MKIKTNAVPAASKPKTSKVAKPKAALAKAGDVFYGTLSGRRVLLSAETGAVVLSSEGLAVAIGVKAKELGLNIVSRAAAKEEARLSYERTWAKEHTPPTPPKETNGKKKSPVAPKAAVAAPALRIPAKDGMVNGK